MRLIIVTIGIFFLLPAIASTNKFTRCSEENCPLLEPILTNKDNLKTHAIIFETSPDHFMQRSTAQFADKKHHWRQITFNQTIFEAMLPIIGFGGAFTDSAGIIYKNLPEKLQEKLIQAYFSDQGIAYSLGRVPIASSDFSCRKLNSQGQAVPSLDACSPHLSTYSYVDIADPTLQSFALQPEDLQYKIPMIKAALAAAQEKNFKLFASVWSAPAWMKDNGKMVHGHLLAAFQPIWANYFIKFLEHYQNLGIKFWALTVQNEPEENTILGKPFQTWQTMFYTAEQEAAFVKNYLGPLISQFNQRHDAAIKIMIHDDQVFSLFKKTSVMKDPQLAKFVGGAGLHWYTNTDLSYASLDKVFHALNLDSDLPQRFILATESCQGFMPLDHGPKLGNWSRGMSYAHDIIADLKHYVSGWTDWNLVLDMQGGPNWANNIVDAPILADLKNNILYLQPMYYFFGHFSKFIRPEAKMLKTKKTDWFLEEVTLKVPAYANLPTTIVVVVLNRSDLSHRYVIKDDTRTNKAFLNLTIPARSIQTILYAAQ